MLSKLTRRFCIGPPQAARSYLSVPAILDAARATGAEAIHPGYGFLSENAAFAEACEAEGFTFIGPTPDQMRSFGLKHTSRSIAAESQLPLLPGTGLLADAGAAMSAAEKIGYPVMLKSTAGGGGIGMRLCRTPEELASSFEVVARLGRANFGDAGLFLERAVTRARHIEVQILGDGRGGVVALGERDCSAQRRNQKVIEETPAPGITTEVRTRLGRCRGTARAVRAVSLRRNRGVSLRRLHGRVLLPGSEYSPPGGTRRHRGGDRSRFGGVHDPDRERRDCAAPCSAARRLDPSASVRRRPGARLSALRRPDHRDRMAGRRAHRNVDRSRVGGVAVLRSHARQDHRERREPGRSRPETS